MMSSTQTNSCITTILCLAARSSSLSYRVFQEEVAGIPLLAWWAEQVADAPGVNRVVVLVQSGGDREIARSLLGSSEAEVYLSKCSGVTRSLAGYIEERGEARIALVRLGLPFGPRRLLEHACVHHERCCNEVTEIKGMPRGLSPIVLQASVLNILGRLEVAGAPTDPIDLYRRICSMGTQTMLELGLTGASVPFDAGAVYCGDGSILPWKVEVTASRDVETCRRVLARLGDTKQDGISALLAWREEQYRDQAAEWPNESSSYLQ